MTLRYVAIVCVAGLLSCITLAEGISADAIQSEFSSIQNKKNCKNISIDKLTGDRVDYCRGVRGYGLNVLYDDSRVSLNVITPTKQIYELAFWDIVTGRLSSFSSSYVEWFVSKSQHKPIALVVSLFEYPSQEDALMVRQVPVAKLVVVKIQEKEACVVGVLTATQKSLKQQIKQWVLDSVGVPCLKKIN